MDEYLVRSLSPTELSLPLDWAAAEGWNPGLNDASAFAAQDPAGFLVGELAGRSIATISAVRYGADFGFIGFYIVHPSSRGRGFGWRLWQSAIAHLAGRTIGLDGVVAQQGNYRRSGFVLAHRNIRYGGFGVAAPLEAGLTPLASVPESALLEYDRRHFGWDRPNFLQVWRSLPNSAGWALWNSGALRGFGCVRRCRSGCKIGPLFADTEAGAERLFNALAGFAPGEPLFLDLPEPNGAARVLAERHQLAPVFETARMYAGPAPALPLIQIYGITSFELG